jgi:hypothetical protein
LVSQPKAIGSRRAGGMRVGASAAANSAEERASELVGDQVGDSDRGQHAAITHRHGVRPERQRRHDAAPAGQQVDHRVPQRAIDQQPMQEHHRRPTPACITHLHAREP